MQLRTAWVGLALLIAGTGFSKTVTTARNHAEGSDVVLESVVQEVKDTPVDTQTVVADTVQLFGDETSNAVVAVKSVRSGASPHDKVKRDGMLEIDNAWYTSPDIVFRSYKISDNIGALLLNGLDGTEAASVEVSAFFDDVVFAKGASAYYMPKLDSLLVYQTMDNMLSVENILATYQGAHSALLDHQVEIETKFVEVSQKTLNELGFSWHFDSKNGGDLELFSDLVFPAGQDILASGLRSAATAINATSGDAGVLAVSKVSGNLQWDVFISALEQESDTDVLSAPRVVTLDGNTATIHVGQNRMMPQAFDINNKDTSPYVEPTDWENEQLGVYMEVTPEIREEGLIDLELNTRVMDILGYDSYQVVPKYTGVDSDEDTSNWVPHLPRIFVGNPTSKSQWNAPLAVGDMPAIDASLPYCRIRALETTVTVADGSTVGMGGLIYDKIETFRDKVPILGSIPYLGRLFRSEGEQHTKRNLIIFVKATQVDVDGRRNADVVLNK